MARPPKRKQDRRTRLFQVRLQERERRDIYKAAKKKRLDASAWARSVLLGETEQILERSTR